MGFDWSECPEVLRDFLNCLYVVRCYSENTVRAYGLDLLCFFRFLRDYKGLDVCVAEFDVLVLLGVEEADVIAFLVYLNFYRNNTASTRRRRLCCIKCFYRWLICNFPASNGKNPTECVPKVRGMERLPRVLSLEQARRIRCVFTLCNSLYPVRDNMIVSLFLSTGMRLSELCYIDLEDVDFERGCICVVGKGNRERLVWLNKRVMNELLDYLRWRNERFELCCEGPLFVGHQNRRLGVSGIERVCKRAFDLMGLGDCGYTTHSLRHTAATIMYEYAGVDILLLKEFLGHDSIEATKIYTHVCDRDLKRAMERHPLSDFGMVA